MTDAEKVNALLVERTQMISDLNRYKHTCAQMMTRINNQENEINYLQEKAYHYSNTRADIKKELQKDFQSKIDLLLEENLRFREQLLKR